MIKKIRNKMFGHRFGAGFSFGITSAVITTLGLMVGLTSGTHSKLVVVGGVLTIAIADAFSDSLGMHISQEAQKKTTKEIWQATISTFFTKLCFALTFLIPILLFELSAAVIINVLWGLMLITLFSATIAKQNKEKTWKVVAEHLIIAVVVVIISYFVGKFVDLVFE